MKTHIHHPLPVINVPPRFSKPPRLIEKATSNPNEVITETFVQTPVEELQEFFLPNWLRVTLTNTNSPYSGAHDREMLYEFYEQLFLFIKAVLLLHRKRTIDAATFPLHSNFLSIIKFG